MNKCFGCVGSRFEFGNRSFSSSTIHPQQNVRLCGVAEWNVEIDFRGPKRRYLPRIFLFFLYKEVDFSILFSFFFTMRRGRLARLIEPTEPSDVWWIVGLMRPPPRSDPSVCVVEELCSLRDRSDSGTRLRFRSIDNPEKKSWFDRKKLNDNQDQPTNRVKYTQVWKLYQIDL